MYLTRSLLILAVCAASVIGQTPAPACTDEIRDEVCLLPDCRCSGSDIPGGLPASEIPQLVFLTFDDAVSIDNFPFYEVALFNRTNPNGQPITASFFITHEYTNYSMVHELYRRGHDVGLHSITHNPSTIYWAELNETGWRSEIVDQKQQMAQFARVPPDMVKGMRAPFLQTGGDRMYQVLSQNGFEWECSRPTLNYRKPGLWPYTNNYQSTQDCQIGPCPTGKYDGFWTVPMVDMLGGNGEGCAMVDACNPVPGTEQATFDLLWRNFQDNYQLNKAPFGIFTHSAWLNGTGSPDIPERRKGYEKFLDEIAKLPDVYIVSVSRALEWIKKPTRLADLADFEPFKVELKPSQCPLTVSCPYFNPERWFHSCSACPAVYPWVGNPLGRP